MNNIISVCLILLSLAVCGGCRINSPKPQHQPVTSETPVPKLYLLTTQEKLQAVYHWGLLAGHISDLIKVALETKHTTQLGRPIYVAPSGLTPFEKVFRDLLMTKLFETGLSISNNPEQCLLLSFDIELVKHPKRPVGVKNEIIITSSLTYNDLYIMRDSSVYYINGPEWWQYSQRTEINHPPLANYTLTDK